MKKPARSPAVRRSIAAVICGCVLLLSLPAAAFEFSDERFRGELTTANLDRIIEAYELYDGWYWTTPADTLQTYHGVPESPGWTSTSEKLKLRGIRAGWYGCRWPVDRVRSAAPDQGGYAECFAFAQFIGYLLSGEVNPQHNWKFFYSVEAAGGSLQVGDILRTEYRYKKNLYQHSAVVYAVNGEEILFLQVSGGSGNRISIGKGFTDGHYKDLTDPEAIAEIPGLKISRYRPGNAD